MSWSFGTPTNTQLSVSQIGMGANLRTGLVAGWWNPTTLTSGRAYWSHSNINSARVAATTSEMTLHLDMSTTDGVWTTSGAGVVINQWQFLAFMLSTQNTGPAAAWRVWRGTADTPPVEVTVNLTTAPTGTMVGATTHNTGNLTGGTVPLQGLIGSNVAAVKEGTVNAGSSLRGPLKTAAFGAITQAEADLVLQRVVTPLWLGNKYPDDLWDYTADAAATQYVVGFQPMEMASPNPLQGQSLRLLLQQNGLPVVGMTISNNPTYSQEREPSSWNQTNIFTRGFRRR
jgi:hypothetical protein